MKRKFVLLLITLMLSTILLCACTDSVRTNSSLNSTQSSAPHTTPSSIPDTTKSSTGTNDIVDDKGDDYDADAYRVSEKIYALETEKCSADECECYQDHVEPCWKIPIVPVFRILGAEIFWETPTIAQITWRDSIITLNTEQGTMINEDGESMLEDVLRHYDGGPSVWLKAHTGGKGKNFWINEEYFLGSLIYDMFTASGIFIREIDFREIEGRLYLYFSFSENDVLFVNDVMFENATVAYEEDTGVLKLPIVEFLTAYGFTLENMGSARYSVSKDGKEYVLDFSQKTFIENGTEENLLANNDNRETYRCEYVYKDGELNLMIDKDTMISFFDRLGIHILKLPYYYYFFTDNGKQS